MVYDNDILLVFLFFLFFFLAQVVFSSRAIDVRTRRIPVWSLFPPQIVFVFRPVLIIYLYFYIHSFIIKKLHMLYCAVPIPMVRVSLPRPVTPLSSL